MKTERKKLMILFIPIFFETISYMLAGTIDTLMLSSVGDNAVGAVGTANTYVSIFIIMFYVVCSGIIAVMTQYIGAGKSGVAKQAKNIGLVFNVILGVIISFVLLLGSKQILSIVGVADALMDYANSYLRIVGAASILSAIIPIYTSYLRAFGYGKEPLVGTIVGNVVNFILNAFFLFVLNMGVVGVAIATVISRIVNLMIVMYYSKKLVKISDDHEKLPVKLVFGQIIKIGFPAALESALYNVAITIIISFLNRMDSEGINVTARSYASQITNFSFAAVFALSQANAIMTGWRMGSEEYEECYKETNKSAIIGIIIATSVQLVFASMAGIIMSLFTDDTRIISLVSKILFIDVILEIGKVANMVYGNALKTSGDAIFPSVIAAIFMFLLAVGGAWFLGLKLEFFVVGAYIGMALDECVRGLLMYGRWRSRIWIKKRISA